MFGLFYISVQLIASIILRIQFFISAYFGRFFSVSFLASDIISRDDRDEES